MRGQMTEERIQKLIREGRGQGEGAAYQPFLRVNDLSSQGRCHRIWCEKFGRALQLFSDIEKAVALILSRARSVTNAYEQYPVDRSLSQAMALEAGIRHPTYPGTKVPVMMTLDFLAVVKNTNGRTKIGINVSTSDKAANPRAVEKLEIMRRCLARQGFAHHVIFDTQIPKQLVRNIEWIGSARSHQREVLPYGGYLPEATERLLTHLSGLHFGERPLRLVCEEFDASTGDPPGTALRAARLLIDAYILNVDLNVADVHGMPMRAFSLSSQDSLHAVRGVA